jgi:hypothetical protein
MDQEEMRKVAHRKWEDEGRPDCERERHGLEAEDDHGRSMGTPQTMPSDHNSGVSPPTGGACASKVERSRLASGPQLEAMERTRG